MAVSHVFTSPIADATGTVTVWQGSTTASVAASDIIKPGNWNSAHNQFLTLGGNTAGASTVSGTNIVWAGGNNITLSGNGSTVTISGPNVSQYLTTAALSNHSHGNPTLALTNLSGTTASASNGFTLSLSGGGSPMSTYAPLQPVSTGVQTLASASGQSSSGSMLMVPFQVPSPLVFTRIDMAHQLSYLTSATAGAINNTYKMLWGLYSMNANTLSLISSSSFSIAETVNSVSLTWSYPSTTASDSYGYGSFPGGNLTTSGQISSLLSGFRQIGMNFGNSVSLSPGQYWLGIMSGRTTGGGSSTFGLSHVGIVANVNMLHVMNRSLASTSGGVMLAIGVNGSNWTTAASHVTGWNGRPIGGFLSATSVADYGGTAIPSAISLTRLAAVANNSTVTVTPLMTFYG